MTFQQTLEDGKKVITAEVTPPHGTDVSHFLNTAEMLKPHVHAFNITDNQRALMRMSGLACASLLVKHGMEPIWQLTCRDRNLLALQSDILGAHALGVQNVLALTGDPVGAGDTASAKAVFQFEAVGLLNLIAKLNDGLDVNDKKLQGAAKLFPGAVVNPGARAVDPQIKRLEKKMKSGAKFFQTQAVFSIQQMEDFMAKVKPLGCKIIAGVLLVRSLKTAQFLQDKVPGIFVPDELFKTLSEAKNPEEAGIDYAAKLVKNYLELCDGVHLMAIRAEEKLISVLNRAGVSKS
jgi:methylenetetrahydrofolate reductase (NADPH)